MRTDIKFTYEEYRTLPETGPRYQVIEGDLFMTPAPTSRHQRIIAHFFNALFNFAEPRQLGTVWCSPVDVILSSVNIVQPDVAFVAKARESIIVPEGMRGAPTLCVEVLSESTKALDIKAKRVLYARYGVKEYWIVDPIANTVEVLRLRRKGPTTRRKLGETDALTTELLPGFSLGLERVFKS